MEVEGQCLEVRGLGDGCFPYGTDVMLDDVSLEECIRACDTSYECMYEHRIGYAFGVRSCWLAPPCIAKGSAYTHLEYLGCVTGYDESWVWREQPSIDECDTVHPSWTRFEDLSIPECIEACEQVADCSTYRTVQYAIDGGTCIVDASCSPKPVGFAEITYEPAGACAP